MFNLLKIDCKRLLYNLNIIKKRTGSKICAMVKANAYGLGVKQVVKILNEKVEFLGVETADEADELAKLTNAKILIVGALQRGRIKNYSYAVSSVEDLKYLIKKNKKINIHIKVNTGMNRFGCNFKELKNMVEMIKNSQLNLEGVFTHFATSDRFSDLQYKRFMRAKRFILSQGLKPIFHADNSANLFKHDLDMVRIGFALYNECQIFKPVASIDAKVLQIREIKAGELVGYDYNFVASQKMKIALVSLGYADGFSRKYIGMKLVINGQFCKVLNVCMDCFMLDVSALNLKVGDSLPILDDNNSLQKYANFAQFSPYEVMTNFGHIRAKRKITNLGCLHS